MRRNKFHDSANQKQRFSLRKLTIGTVSVLLGTTFYLTTTSTSVKADTSNNSNESNVVAAESQSLPTTNQNVTLGGVC